MGATLTAPARVEQRAPDRPLVRPGAPRFHRSLMALEALLAVGAVYGGVGMLLDPTGFMPADYLDRTPFETWAIPGIALLLVNGLLPSIAAFMELRRDWQAPVAHLIVGIATLSWIAVQVAVTPARSWLQIAIVAIGATVLGLGAARQSRRLAMHRHPSFRR